jgi:predicted enzyme related to lactoylglutathione lyase
VTQQPRLEAVFVAADDPEVTATAITHGVAGGTTTTGPDGQHLVEGLGTFLAMEPTRSEAPAGTITLWFRVDDVANRIAAMRASGAEVVSEPARAGDETVATVRLPQGITVGLIA